MKTPQEVDRLMEQIPPEARHRWCGGERGPCACLGCVQICNRTIMVREMGVDYHGDPEYIDESKIPPDIYARTKITHEEWEDWVRRHPRHAPI